MLINNVHRCDSCGELILYDDPKEGQRVYDARSWKHVKREGNTYTIDLDETAFCCDKCERDYIEKTVKEIVKILNEGR